MHSFPFLRSYVNGRAPNLRARTVHYDMNGSAFLCNGAIQFICSLDIRQVCGKTPSLPPERLNDLGNDFQLTSGAANEGNIGSGFR